MAGEPDDTATYLRARRLRLASGVILLIYVTLHLINHALGIWSLRIAEIGLRWSEMVWQSVPGTVLLYGAALLHVFLACQVLYLRRNWQLPVIEWLRLWAGFGLPLLLIGHVVGTRVAGSVYHTEPTYSGTVANLLATGAQGWQLALLAPGWLHGCLGLWISLRHLPSMQRAKPLLLGAVILIPTLSALGFAEMTRAVLATGRVAQADPVAMTRHAMLDTWARVLTMTYLGLIVGAFAAGRLRATFVRSDA
jgi:adenylate cyclase